VIALGDRPSGVRRGGSVELWASSRSVRGWTQRADL
jgi:hypothetical protein